MCSASHCQRWWLSRTIASAASRRSASSSVSISRSISGLMRSSLASRSSTASSKASLFFSDSSILRRSISSEYSPRRSNGITTSSLILNAFVCRAMAAVRPRSSQKFRRASALTAIKPSPCRALAMRTTFDAAIPTASSLSPTMSASNTIFGRPLRLALAA